MKKQKFQWAAKEIKKGVWEIALKVDKYAFPLQNFQTDFKGVRKILGNDTNIIIIKK